MRRFTFHVSMILLLCCLILSGCSGGNDPSQAKETGKSVPEKAQNAVREYSSRPIEKARAAQQLGLKAGQVVDGEMMKRILEANALALGPEQNDQSTQKKSMPWQSRY